MSVAGRELLSRRDIFTNLLWGYPIVKSRMENVLRR